MDIETGVKQLLIDVLDLDLVPDQLANDTRLLGEGLQINSVVGLQILVLLQRRFGFEVHEADLTPELFLDIGHLVAFAERKVSAKTTETHP